MQVLKTGQSNKVNEFGFKGYFLQCKQLCFGKSDPINKMLNNVIFKNKIYFENKSFEEEQDIIMKLTYIFQ